MWFQLCWNGCTWSIQRCLRYCSVEHQCQIQTYLLHPIRQGLLIQPEKDELQNRLWILCGAALCMIFEWILVCVKKWCVDIELSTWAFGDGWASVTEEFTWLVVLTYVIVCLYLKYTTTVCILDISRLLCTWALFTEGCKRRNLPYQTQVQTSAIWPWVMLTEWFFSSTKILAKLDDIQITSPEVQGGILQSMLRFKAMKANWLFSCNWGMFSENHKSWVCGIGNCAEVLWSIKGRRR